MTYKIQPVSTSSVILIITLLVTSVTSQIIEFDPSLNNTIYIEVCTYICCNFHFSCWLPKCSIALQSYKILLIMLLVTLVYKKNIQKYQMS